jgi:hypothetical protein
MGLSGSAELDGARAAVRILKLPFLAAGLKGLKGGALEVNLQKNTHMLLKWIPESHNSQCTTHKHALSSSRPPCHPPHKKAS